MPQKDFGASPSNDTPGEEEVNGSAATGGGVTISKSSLLSLFLCHRQGQGKHQKEGSLNLGHEIEVKSRFTDAFAVTKIRNSITYCCALSGVRNEKNFTWKTLLSCLFLFLTNEDGARTLGTVNCHAAH